jgi:hypothetical protein
MAPGWPGMGATQAANKPAALLAAAIFKKERREYFVVIFGILHSCVVNVETR